MLCSCSFTLNNNFRKGSFWKRLRVWIKISLHKLFGFFYDFIFLSKELSRFYFFFPVFYVLHCWSLLLFYLVEPFVFLFVWFIRLVPQCIQVSKSRLSTTAWLTVRWPRIRPTSWTVWSGGRGTCVVGFFWVSCQTQGGSAGLLEVKKKKNAQLKLYWRFRVWGQMRDLLRQQIWFSRREKTFLNNSRKILLAQLKFYTKTFLHFSSKLKGVEFKPTYYTLICLWSWVTPRPNGRSNHCQANW